MPGESSVKFRTRVLQARKTATGIEVPATIVTALGAGKRPKVAVTINGHTYRSSIAVMGGKYLVGISAEVREKTGIAAGDEIDVDIELDTAPRVVSVPYELRVAFERHPRAKRAFDALSYSRQQRYTLPIEKAKSDDTRERNVHKAIRELQKG
jgi:bifunctional DNA-binding transcriptional regulator/antitoxin component of YhaV-PrlF toxin-antitoxin module